MSSMLQTGLPSSATFGLMTVSDVDLNVAVAVGRRRRLGRSIGLPVLAFFSLAAGSFSRISLRCSE